MYNLVSKILIAFGLAFFSTTAVGQSNKLSEPPLPKGTMVASPDGNVPAEFLSYLGIWSALTNMGWYTFAVVDVDSSGTATCIWAWNANGVEVGHSEPRPCVVRSGVLSMDDIYRDGDNDSIEAVLADGKMTVAYKQGAAAAKFVNGVKVEATSRVTKFIMLRIR